MRAPLRHPARAPRGLSIVELLVGITISLFIMAAATMLASTQLGDNRRLMLEAQIQQDARAVLDVAVRDVRQAGYWAKAWNNVWQDSSATSAMANPYNAVTSSSSMVEYDRSQDEVTSSPPVVGTDDNIVTSGERVGFRYNSSAKTVEMLIGDAWQTLTDPAVMQVDSFDVTVTARILPLPCGSQCAPATLTCPALGLQVRDVTISLQATSASDSSVKRSARVNVRLRNDVLTCTTTLVSA